MRTALTSFVRCVSLGLMAAFASVAAANEAIDAQSALDRKIAAILPSAEEERWLRIPWHTNIAEARAEAQRLNKPLLLWVMNGNPLGCA